MTTHNDVRVYFQSHGFQGCDKRWLVNGDHYATASDTAPTTNWYKLPNMTVVVEHPDGTLLFDASNPRDWRERWRGTSIDENFPYEDVADDQYFDESLGRLGIATEDLSALILSHLHYDHAGNLNLLADAGVRSIVQKAELDGAMAINGAYEGAFIKADYENAPMDTIEGDVEILPGVTLLSLPGHTWGTMGLLVEFANDRPLLYTGDAVYMAESYGPPAVGSPIAWSSLDWLESVEKVRAIAERTNARVVFGHDYNMVTEDLLLAPKYYS